MPASTAGARANFSTSPNVYVSRDIEKGKAVKVTDTNPQMAEYNWGTAQLFKWYTYDAGPAEGVLYLPEDFSPDKEYPMISYFYETYTEDLYTHYDMEAFMELDKLPFLCEQRLCGVCARHQIHSRSAGRMRL